MAGGQHNKMHNKVTSAADAVAVIQNGDALCTSGFVGIGVPDGLLNVLFGTRRLRG
jgi:propionate CoA-transferase